MMYMRCPLSLRNAEDLLRERGIDITREAVRFWWNRFGALFATEIRWSRVQLQFAPRSLAGNSETSPLPLTLPFGAMDKTLQVVKC